ncbi:MAG: chemotaxis protein CheD [Spirochaetes bacterium]|nr:chemotaxis protein CheD [Spirochaetota bacterium]
MNIKKIDVGIGEYRTAFSPAILRTILGSCVSLALYDPIIHVGSMGHVVLPEFFKSSGTEERFADRMIPLMITDLQKKGARIDRLIARIAGGANMYSRPGGPILFDVGNSNVRAVKRLVTELDIPILSNVCGGHSARIVTFDLSNGRVRVDEIKPEISVMKGDKWKV